MLGYTSLNFSRRSRNICTDSIMYLTTQNIYITLWNCIYLYSFINLCGIVVIVVVVMVVIFKIHF